jgi:FlaA1/EpsC-like NDP-sugar epimerase
MEERNAWQAVRNNAWGTGASCAALAACVEKFVLVSTDKAVNPTNVMGASKRMAKWSARASKTARHSSSSFVLAMLEAPQRHSPFPGQIARGGPVTVTHPSITRYFMSLSEATQLLLQAGLMGRAARLLDMGSR